jgi:hypothetical protein
VFWESESPIVSARTKLLLNQPVVRRDCQGCGQVTSVSNGDASTLVLLITNPERIQIDGDNVEVGRWRDSEDELDC